MASKKDDKSELDYLYLTHPENIDSGAYNQIDWSTRIHAAASSPQARFVTIHEMLHSDLNNSTAYGTVLIVLADICRKNSEKIEFRRTLKKLVNRCRTVHEVFATTGAFLLLNQKSATEDLLLLYPDYFRYHKIGSSLCRAFKGFTLQYNSLYSVIRACMHSPAPARVLEIGFDGFRLKDLRASDCPDNRLHALRLSLTDQFWKGAIEQARSDCPNQEFWSYIDQEEQGIQTNIIASESRFDTLVDDLVRSFFNSCTGVLQAQGIESLSFNGHQAYTEPLLESAVKYYSDSPSIYPTLQASQKEQHEELIVRNLEYERLVLQEPYEGQLFRLDEIPANQWSTCIAGDTGNEHYFLCAKPAAKISNQYIFTEKENRFLKSKGNEPMLFLRASRIDEKRAQRIVQLFFIQNPKTLDFFSKECLGDKKAICSVSMSCYLNGNWKTKWDKALSAISQMALLLDISPTAVMKYWTKVEHCRVGYELINLQIDEDVRSVLAFDFQTASWPLVLAPCSSVTADGLIMYMNSGLVPKSSFEHRQEIVTENQFLLSVVLGHVFREEPWFDFQGAITEGTGEETEQ